MSKNFAKKINKRSNSIKISRSPTITHAKSLINVSVDGQGQLIALSELEFEFTNDLFFTLFN
jgi:hypothetical protein